MAHDFQRPGLPYDNESLQNDKRYQLITRSNNRPATDVMFDTDFNYVIDGLRQLDSDIADIEAGILQGADNPANANFLPTTDGAGNISWVDISDINIRGNSVTGSKLFAQAITVRELGDGAVTTLKLATNSVTTIKMLDFNVTANKLAPDSVLTDKIVDLNVTANKLAPDSVLTDKIVDLNVTTDKLADGAITLPKINAIIPVTMGGSGLNTLTTPNGVICAGTTATGVFQNAGVGSLNQIYMGNGNDAVGSWKNFNTLAGSKANQITGTADNVYVTPAVQQFHNSSAKAHFMWSQGVTLESYNCTVSMTSPGVFTVTFTVPFSSNNYSVGGSVGTGAGGQVLVFSTLTTATRLAASIQINVYNSSLGLAGGTFQPSVLDLQFYGQQ